LWENIAIGNRLAEAVEGAVSVTVTDVAVVEEVDHANLKAFAKASNLGIPPSR